MTDHKKERFIRWQAHSLEYFAYAINLFLGLAIAAIGFEMSLLQSSTFILTGWQKCTFSVSLFSILISSGLGIACVLNRIRDLRDTTTIARKKSKEEYDQELEDLRELVGIISARTRTLFSIQVFGFSVGVLSLVIVMLSVYSEKLF